MNVTRTIEVKASVERAFEAFTQRVSMWWPPGHRMSGESNGWLQFEPRVGGRFFETASDGREFEYGRVLVWSPPSHLAYAFFPGSGADRPTRVDVRFEATDAGTRVDVVHAPGELDASEFEQRAVRYERSWSEVLPAFARFVSPDPTPTTA